MSNVQALIAALNAERSVSDSYITTDVQGYLRSKVTSIGLLQINTTGTTYEQITHIAFSNASVSKTGTSPTVLINPVQVYCSHRAWLDTTKTDVTNSSITTQSNPKRIDAKVTPAMADITGLQRVKVFKK